MRAGHLALTISTGSGLECARSQTLQAPQSSAFQHSWTPLITAHHTPMTLLNFLSQRRNGLAVISGF
jgi:hypothetical protein